MAGEDPPLWVHPGKRNCCCLSPLFPCFFWTSLSMREKLMLPGASPSFFPGLLSCLHHLSVALGKTFCSRNRKSRTRPLWEWEARGGLKLDGCYRYMGTAAHLTANVCHTDLRLQIPFWSILRWNKYLLSVKHLEFSSALIWSHISFYGRERGKNNIWLGLANGGNLTQIYITSCNWSSYCCHRLGTEWPGVVPV